MLRALTSVVRSNDDAGWDTRRAWSRFSARLHEPRLTLHLDRWPAAPSRGRVWLAVGAGTLAAGALIAIVWWPAHSGRPSIGAPAVSEIDGAREGLVFDDVTLSQAAIRIGRRFGVRVDIADSALGARHLSARFRDEPHPRVLDTNSAALGARWTRDGDRVLFEEAH